MSVTQIPVGVDVSKLWLDASSCGRTARLDNDASGFEELKSWLGPGAFHVCVEATGGHETALRVFCEAHGWSVSVANAAQVSAYGRATGRRHKTDKVDAQLLERYLVSAQPPLSVLARESRRHLKRLVLTWKDLQGQVLALDSRLRSPEMPSSAVSGLEAAKVGLEMAMLALMDDIARLLEQEQDLAEELYLLESIKGIGRVSGLQILAHLPEGELRSARELASYAGTVPCQYESGSSVRGRSRVSIRCNRRLRTVLYMSALVARRFCPHLKAFADRLVERGKSKKQAIVAVMRKLTHAIFAVLTSKQAYNGAKLCPNS